VADRTAPFKLDATITVQKDPGPRSTTSYYWSHQFSFTDSKPADARITALADAALGSIGIHTEQGGHGVSFTLWNAVSGSGRNCGPFKGDGKGWLCMYPLAWRAGVPYRFRVSLLRRVPAGDTFRGTVKDMRPGGKEIRIGDLFVPAYYGQPRQSLYAYEIYEQVPSCAQFDPAKVQFRCMGPQSPPARGY